MTSSSGFHRVKMAAHMIRQLFQNELALLSLILPARGLAVKHGFSVSEQGGELMF